MGGMRYSLTSHLSPLTSLLILFSSCEKEIDIDYHQIDPLYVVEAYVSDNGMQARISMTNDMDNNDTSSSISGANVTISGSDGSSETLPYVGVVYF